MPDLSIIIVSWNAKQYLHRCLDSLAGKTSGYSREIIVVDNASDDDSVEFVEKDFPDVKLLKNKTNLGFAKANNIGISQSSGRYICFVNSDIIVLNNCIENMISFMDDHLKVGLAGQRILNPDLSLQCSCRHFPSIWNNLCQTLGLNKLFPKSEFFSEPFMKYWAHDKVRKVDVISGCFWMVRRQAIDEVGLLDEDFFIYGEDIDWCKRFHKAGWIVMFYPGAEAIHFGGASSNNAPVRFYLEMQKADIQYWRKHHGRPGQLAYRMIILMRQLVRLPVYVLVCVFCPKSRSNTLPKLKRALACIHWLFGFYNVSG